MMQWTDLTLPAQPELVGVARRMAVAAAESARLPESRLSDLRTCVSEAVTNAVHAHVAAGVQEPITIRVGHDTDTVVVEIHDHGPGLPSSLRIGSLADPNDLDVEMLAEGGYGIPVMQALADHVDLSHTEGDHGGTIVRLGFKLPAPVG